MLPLSMEMGGSLWVGTQDNGWREPTQGQFTKVWYRKAALPKCDIDKFDTAAKFDGSVVSGDQFRDFP
jgi:hypothetical protein